jgi:hypothetical protein
MVSKTVKAIAEAFQNINLAERLVVFCCTLISIFALFFERKYSLPVVLYCFSGISYFTYLGYFRKEETNDYPEGNIIKRITKSEYEFARGDVDKLIVLKIVSFLFFIFATIIMAYQLMNNF